MKKRIRGNPTPVIVEEHPNDYDGYPFITLLQYHNEHFLTIIDNINEKVVTAYVLDLCGPEHVNEEHIIEVTSMWWDNHRERFPVSFEFSRLGLTQSFSCIHRSFNIEYVTRVIGPLPKFEMSKVTSVKRRKRKNLPDGIEIHENVRFLHPKR